MDISKDTITNTANELEAKILKRLGNFFYNARADKNMSVRALNTLSGVSVAVISDLENAKGMPRIETIIRLALALGINDMNEVFSMTLLDDNKTAVTDEAILRQYLSQTGFNNSEIRQIQYYINFVKYMQNAPSSPYDKIKK